MKDFPEFECDAGRWLVTEAMKKAFDKHGFIVVRNMFSSEAIQKIRTTVESPEFQKYKYVTQDGYDRLNKFVLWNHPGDDVTGLLARSQKIAGTMEQLMGGDELYHYHSKLIMKDAQTGGAFAWHQDYGYWYKNGCMYPDMGTVWIPLDTANKDNGCIEFLAGSHKYGRMDHVGVGEHLQVEKERLDQAKKQLDHVYIEVEPGDVTFFHCNLLHSSQQNHSNRRRWSFVICFNKRTNDPYMKHHHPQYTPLIKVNDSEILACTEKEIKESKWFMKYTEDISSPRLQ